MDRGPPRRPPARRHRLLTVAASVAVHLLALYGLLSARIRAPLTPPAGPTVTAVLVDLRPPVEAPTPPAPQPSSSRPAPARPSPERPTPPKPVRAKPPPPSIVKPRPTPPAPNPAPASEAAAPDESGVSDAQLASAATAGSGSGSGSGPGGAGGTCDMTRRLQDALRKDHLVQAAIAQASPGRAVMVWNGDWVRHGGQDGAGLAAVREAMMWEIAFAPQACRTRPVHGLIQISLAEGPGAARLVIGQGDWRWTDLLLAHNGVR